MNPLTNKQTHQTPEAPSSPIKWLLDVKRYALILAALWTLAAAFSLTWNVFGELKAMREIADAAARASFYKDVVFRHWNAQHGGVYAPITETTQPNPYLDIEERDIETPSGRRLTLINPAYMTRQVHELQTDSAGVRGHITSLNPIRPANAPDIWERQALKSFELGITEAASVEMLEGESYLRLMRPFVTEQSCLACHASQGYKVGEIRGGISVSIPMAPYTAIARRKIAILGVGHGALWVLGLLGLHLAMRGLQSRSVERDHAIEALCESEERYRRAQAAGHVGNWEYNLQTTEFVTSDEGKRIYGFDLDDTSFSTDEVEKCIPERERIHQALVDLIENDKPYNLEFEIHPKNGAEPRIISSIAELKRDEHGAPLKVGGIIQDITERKRAEQALRESEARARLMADLVTNSDQPVAVGFADGRLGRFNPAFCGLVGYTEKEMKEIDWAVDLTPPDWLPAERETLAELERTGEPVRYEKEYIRKDGTRVPVELFVHLAHDKDGSPDYYYAFITDITDRKQAEDALRRSEATLRKAQEVAHLGSWELDLVTERFILSDEAYHMYRQEPREDGLLRADFMEWVHPDDRSYGEKLFKALLAEGEATFEYRAIHPGGEVRWITGRGITSFDQAGNPLKMFGIQQDITDRKQVEEELRQSERRLILSQETAHLGTWELDLSTTRIIWTDEVYRIFGMAPGEIQLTYESVLERVYPEDRDKKDQVTEQIVKQGSARFEYRIVRPNGDIRWISGQGEIACDETGTPVRMFGIAQDITERKRTEEELRRESSMLQLALEASQTGAWYLNLYDHSSHRTPGHDQIFGYEEPLDEWTYEEFLEHVHPEDREAVDRKFQQAIASETDWSFECRICRPNGDVRWIWAVGRLDMVRDSGTQIMGGVVQDITDRKRAEGELRESHDLLETRVEERTSELKARKDEAETLSRAMINLLHDLKETNLGLETTKEALRITNSELEAFSYSVSHDLRAPLRHIDGFVKLLLKREKEQLDAISARYLNTIAQSSGRMGRLIDDLLAFSRTGRAEMHRNAVDSNEVIQEIVEEMSPETEGRHLVWEIGDLPVVQADGNLLRQVWQNLIGNAIKYTAPREEARIEIGLMPESGEEGMDGPVFFIRDNGVGFDPQYTHKLFGVFQRLHRDDEFEGTGIGLATVRRIVHRHGGRVWAEGEIDDGAAFYFTLQNE